MAGHESVEARRKKVTGTIQLFCCGLGISFTAVSYLQRSVCAIGQTFIISHYLKFINSPRSTAMFRTINCSFDNDVTTTTTTICLFVGNKLFLHTFLNKTVTYDKYLSTADKIYVQLGHYTFDIHKYNNIITSN